MINQLIDDGFRAAHLPEPPRIYRYDQGEQRYYARVMEQDGGVPRITWFPSVTTVIRNTTALPPHLLKWYADKGMDEANTIRDTAAEYGTTFHMYAALLMAGHTIPGPEFAVMDPRLQKDIVALVAFIREHDVEPLAVEMLMASDALGIAGTVDMVARMKWRGARVTAVVDFKTSAGLYREHELQVEMYRQMWNETYGGHELSEPLAKDYGLPTVKPYFVAHSFLWRPKDWRSAPTYELKEVEGNISYEEVLATCQLYSARHPEWSPKPRRIMRHGDITMRGDLPTMDTEDPDVVVMNKYQGVTA